MKSSILVLIFAGIYMSVSIIGINSTLLVFERAVLAVSASSSNQSNSTNNATTTVIMISTTPTATNSTNSTNSTTGTNTFNVQVTNGLKFNVDPTTDLGLALIAASPTTAQQALISALSSNYASQLLSVIPGATAVANFQYSLLSSTLSAAVAAVRKRAASSQFGASFNVALKSASTSASAVQSAVSSALTSATFTNPTGVTGSTGNSNAVITVTSAAVIHNACLLLACFAVIVSRIFA